VLIELYAVVASRAYHVDICVHFLVEIVDIDKNASEVS
jgi:hypothetical protein